MVTRQRTDLHMNIPALRKLDAMLIVRTQKNLCFSFMLSLFIYKCTMAHIIYVEMGKQDCLENFKDQNEFYYVSKDADESEKGNTKRKDDKWWLPTPKVPPNGLCDVSRKWLQFQKDSVNQVLKAAMAINAQVLSEMEIPDNYIESLPKVRRQSDINYALLFGRIINLIDCDFDFVEWESEPGGLDL